MNIKTYILNFIEEVNPYAKAITLSIVVYSVLNWISGKLLVIYADSITIGHAPEMVSVINIIIAIIIAALYFIFYTKLPRVDSRTGILFCFNNDDDDNSLKLEKNLLRELLVGLRN